MSKNLTQRTRDRAWMYLDEGVAAVAPMSLAQVQQFVGGTDHPTDDQIRRLARRMSIQ
jgi:hypothetical protein